MRKVTRMSIDALKQTMPVLTAIVCLCLSAPAYSQAYHPADKAKLDATYAELVKHPDSKECQMAFFKAFPST
ncbi:MAG: hypothetical protein LBR06_08800, partial [Bacteroidales bacterium]|nr:hypothetical protein [Bacteroidales bacterium]